MNVDMQNAYIAGLASGGVVEPKDTAVVKMTVGNFEQFTVNTNIGATVTIEEV